MVTDTFTKPARKSKGARVLVLVTILLVALIGSVWLWWRSMNSLPALILPIPTLPSPNAFDTFVEATKKIQDDKKVAEALVTRPPQGKHIYTLDEKAQLVAKNAVVLNAFRAGFAQEYYHPPARSFQALYPHFPKFRVVTRLMTLEGQIQAARGKWDAALRSDLDAIQLGLTIPRGSSLIGTLVGIACEAIGRKGAWEKIEKLSASEAKAGARRLETMLAMRVPFDATLEEEKYTLQASLLEVFRDPNWRTRSDVFFGGDDPEASEKDSQEDRIATASIRAMLYFYSNKTILNNLTDYMDAHISYSRRPYIARSAPPSVPSDPINQIIAPICDQADLKDLCAKTQSGMLLLALALRAYRLEHGEYPQTLDVLAPKYLTQMPDDPFSQEAFPYKRTGSKYLLYSVGPDKRDDGGRPIDDPSKVSGSNTNARYFVQPDSQGDIVVGVNRW